MSTDRLCHTMGDIIILLSLGESVLSQSSYSSISPEHTLCKYGGVGPACGQIGGEEEKGMVLDYHNRYAKVHYLLGLKAKNQNRGEHLRSCI